MTSDPVAVTPETPLIEAARLVFDHNVGMLPAVEGAGSPKLVGVITDRDIAARHVAAGHSGKDCCVRDAMTQQVTTYRPAADANEVVTAMRREQVRRISITDQHSTWLGVVSQTDVVREIADAECAKQTVADISAANWFPDGHQLIGAVCGGNFQLGYQLGDGVFVFGLPRTHP